MDFFLMELTNTHSKKLLELLAALGDTVDLSAVSSTVHHPSTEDFVALTTQDKILACFLLSNIFSLEITFKTSMDLNFWKR